MSVYLPAMAVATCLGLGKAATAPLLFTGKRVGSGAIEDLPPGPDSRNNRLLRVLLDEIAEPVADAIRRFGRQRVAVVVGTSTSGMAEGEAAWAHRRAHGNWPAGFNYRQQELGSADAFLRDTLDLGARLRNGLPPR